MSRRMVAVLGAFVLMGSLGVRAQAPPAQAASEPKTTWYFYTVKWGFQDEFLDLFQRNHYPVLKAKEKAGQYLAVRTWVPEFHGDGRADWTFVVELVEPPNPPAAPTTDEVVRRLYPDRTTFLREEQRRFEILAAHWDVPLNRLDLDRRQPAR
jgi:hypothetical protein